MSRPNSLTTAFRRSYISVFFVCAVVACGGDDDDAGGSANTGATAGSGGSGQNQGGSGGSTSNGGSANNGGSGGDSGSGGSSNAGASGSSGNAGSAGDSGASGNSGNAGNSGNSGNSGSSGTSGASGNSGSAGTAGNGGSAGTAGTAGSSGTSGSSGSAGTGNTNPGGGPEAGNPDGFCSVPSEALAEDTSAPDHVVGDGTPASCTSEAVVSAVAQGGIITFNCGPDPITITLNETAKIFNNTGPKIVLDGGGLVTLSGGGAHRILYQNTCDENQVWTTPHCDDQDHPQLTVQNLTFIDGNAKNEDDGGGAIFVRGGQFKIVNSRFFNNVCADVGPDVGGAAVRVYDQFEDRPVYVVHSTFGGADGYGNIGSNGGAISSIGVSWTVINSVMSYNHAIGNGANPAQPGTPGGGSGGAIYNDGNTFTLELCGDLIEHNTANEGGGAIFFVSNDLTGHLIITDSVLHDNPSAGFETQGYPGIFVLCEGDPQVTNSTLD